MIAPTARLGRFAALASALLSMPLGHVTAQVAASEVHGSIGVSLTILQPVSTQAVSVSGFAVDADGMATLELSAPVAGPTSQVVMSSVASSTNGFRPVPQSPGIVRGRRGSTAPARLSYRVDVRATGSPSSTERTIQLRVQHLAVAGT